MAKFVYLFALALFWASPVSFAEEKLVEHNLLMDHGDGHLMDMEGGMVMGQNKDKLPGGCEKISEDAQITVRAGHKYSKKLPGTMFAFDQQEWRLKPCTRLTITFINEDQVCASEVFYIYCNSLALFFVSKFIDINYLNLVGLYETGKNASSGVIE